MNVSTEIVLRSQDDDDVIVEVIKSIRIWSSSKRDKMLKLEREPKLALFIHSYVKRLFKRYPDSI